jgi:hypothetical protein
MPSGDRTGPSRFGPYTGLSRGRCGKGLRVRQYIISPTITSWLLGLVTTLIIAGIRDIFNSSGFLRPFIVSLLSNRKNNILVGLHDRECANENVNKCLRLKLDCTGI